MDVLQDLVIDELISSPVGQKLRDAMEIAETVQSHIYALMGNGKDEQFTLLKIGTVFQLFLVDTLASGKKPNELTDKDWKNIASQVSRYAILEEDQSYSEFVFSRYSDYIRISAKAISKTASKENVSAIISLADEINSLCAQFREETITESSYVEDCLWLSMEAMIKLLAASLGSLMGKELSMLTQAVSQLAFEYGRYVLYAREQALLDAYLNNQRVLDDQLQRQFDTFRQDLQENAAQFQALIDNAYSSDIHDTLRHSAALARAAGMNEKDVLKSIEDVDSFFLDE